MTGGAIDGLDHVGLGVRDLADAGARFERLGFQLTPFAQHSGAADPQGRSSLLSTGNRCAMLRRGYLELISVIDPALPDSGLLGFLESGEGGYIAAFETNEPEATQARLATQGIDSSVAPLQRPVQAGAEMRMARFRRVVTPVALFPGIRILLLRHDTPELIWPPGSTEHPNNVVALDGVTIVEDDPEGAAMRYGAVLGAVPVDQADGWRISLPRGWLEVVSMSALVARHPDLRSPPAKKLAAITLLTSDGNAAFSSIVRAAGLTPLAEEDGALVLRPENGFGCLIVARGAA